jgi:succinate dehydrogenase / fumarate reductase membrane anchor subunit
MRETHWWLLSLACALVILVLLAVHFAVMHYSPVFLGQSIEEVRQLSQVIERGRDAAQMASYMLFLAVALYHGLYGLRGVILELPGAQERQRLVSTVIAIAGLVCFAYGAYVTWWTFTVA